MVIALPPAPTRIGLRAVVVTAVVASQVLLAVVASSNVTAALGLAAVAVGLVIALAWPLLLPLAAFPATFGYWRFGPASVNLSVADIVLLAAIVPGLFMAPWSFRGFRSVMGTIAVYTAIVAMCVALAFSRRAGFEWLHRIALTAGAVMVGATVARLNFERWGLRLLGAAAVIVSITSVIDTVTHSFEAPYPFGIHKNAAGAIIMMVLVLSLTVSSSFGIGSKLHQFCRVVAVVGLLATQSKAAMLALAAVALLWSMRKGVAGSTRALIALVAGVVLVTSWAIYQQNTQYAGDAEKFNTVGSRVRVYEEAIDQFDAHPITGAGLRWFKAPDSPASEPHSALFITLSETGLLGLAALSILLAGTMTSLVRLRTPLGYAATAVVGARLLEGMVAIYWVAGTMTISWLIVGLALGDAARRDEQATTDQRLAFAR